MGLPSSSSSLPIKLAQIIPDYDGYDDRTLRKHSDQKIRLCMIGKIENILRHLSGLPAAPHEEDKRRLSDLSQSTHRKLITISESLRDPTYAGNPFFALDRIPEKRLENIYNHEASMLAGLGGIEEEIAAMMQQKMEKVLFEDHFLHITDFIDNFNQALFERESLILGDAF